MAKVSKYAIMEEAQGYLDDSTVATVKELLQPLVDIAGEADEAREEAMDALGEAMEAHEERNWEDRNDAVERAASAIGTFEDKFSTLVAEISDIDGKMPSYSGLDKLAEHRAAVEGLL